MIGFGKPLVPASTRISLATTYEALHLSINDMFNIQDFPNFADLCGSFLKIVGPCRLKAQKGRNIPVDSAFHSSGFLSL